MGERIVPPATYPSGPTVIGQGTFAPLSITDVKVTIDTPAFTDPAAQIDVRFQVRVNGVWQHAVSCVQNGSPTGTWATKHGTTTLGVQLEASYGSGFVVDGARLGVIVTNGPVDLGQVTLDWS